MKDARNAAKVGEKIGAQWVIVQTRPFFGCVNCDDCNPCAHGGVRYIEARRSKGQYFVRESNSNGLHSEDGKSRPATLEDDVLYWD
jgi:hypothetical protein